LSITL